MRKNVLNNIFGEAGSKFYSTLELLKKEFEESNYQYDFHSEREFEEIIKSNPSRGLHIYWKEMIFRAHMSASTSILRNLRWIDGCIDAYKSENWHSFASSLRGFIEASADNFFSLKDASLTLADMRFVILKALNKELERFFIVNEELEDKLIHHTHARKITDDSQDYPDSHKAKRTGEYLKKIDLQDNYSIGECYGELCQILHPAAQSIQAFLISRRSNEIDKVSLDCNQDINIIDGFCKKYEETFPELFFYGFNPSLMLLGVINKFSLSDFYTETLNKIDLSNIEGWRKIQEAWNRYEDFEDFMLDH